MPLDDYLRLLDWTGRQVRSDKPGVIPAELEPILQRLRVNTDAWSESVAHFGRWFHRAVGRESTMARRAARAGKCWFQGKHRSRQAFG